MHSNIDKFTMDSCIFISNNIQYVTGQKERNNLQAFSDVDLNVFAQHFVPGVNLEAITK